MDNSKISFVQFVWEIFYKINRFEKLSVIMFFTRYAWINGVKQTSVVRYADTLLIKRT